MIQELTKKLQDMSASRDWYQLRLNSPDTASGPTKMTRATSPKKGSRKVCSRTKDQHNKVVPVVSARYLNDTVSSTNKKFAPMKYHTAATPLALSVADNHASHQRSWSEGDQGETSSIPGSPYLRVSGRGGRGGERPLSGEVTSAYRADGEKVQLASFMFVFVFKKFDHRLV